MIPDKKNSIVLLISLGILTVCLMSCGGLTMKMYDTADEQYRQSMKEYQNKNYLKAIDGFQKVVFNFSGASMVDSAQYYIGMSQYYLSEYYLAATEFERVIRNYPGSPFVDDAQYMTGLCYFKAAPKHYGLDQTELQKAIQAFEDFIIEYPESDLIPDCREMLNTAFNRLARKRYENGRLYYRLADYEAARIYFQTVVDEHTDSEWGAKALYYLGEIDHRQGHLEDSRSKFKNFLILYPDHELYHKAAEKLAELDKELVETGKKN
jgi:outer membrane protein assembly factor BamD